VGAIATAGPQRITFVTNPDDCTLSCDMCREHSPFAAPRPTRRRRLPFEVVEEVLEERRGTPLREVIASTKGEPLLWPPLERLVASCQARGLRLNVTTNGTFPGGGSRWARLLVPACRDIKISWNASTPATAAAIMPGLDLERALDALRALVQIRDERRHAGEAASSLSLQVTAQERNVSELPAIVRMAAEMGLDRVKVNQLQVHFPALAGQDLRRSLRSRARWRAAVSSMREAARLHRTPGRPALQLTGADAWDEPGGHDPPHGPCPFLGREAWVTVDGRFAPCPAPAGQDGLLGAFGSVREQPLGAIWRGREYGALLREYPTRVPCARCSLRRPGGL
jgi:MoaA/NifB/PqqE/SkfB family radical SAM enzyme